jgi:hypothetical protein
MGSTLSGLPRARFGARPGGNNCWAATAAKPSALRGTGGEFRSVRFGRRRGRGRLRDDPVVVTLGAEPVQRLGDLVDADPVAQSHELPDCLGAHVVAALLGEQLERAGDNAGQLLPLLPFLLAQPIARDVGVDSPPIRKCTNGAALAGAWDGRGDRGRWFFWGAERTANCPPQASETRALR